MATTLTKADLDAIKSYVDEYGARWKTVLYTDWYNARTRHCEAMPNRGGLLHALRNSHGPLWLDNFDYAKWAKLYEAAQ